MNPEPLTLVVNPRSGAGRTGRDLAVLLAEVDRRFTSYEVRTTERPGHATELTREALRAGARLVVAVGGDGTCNEVVNGFFEDDQPISPEASFSVIPSGTGSDLVRSLRIPREIRGALNMLAEPLAGGERNVDLLDCTLGDGRGGIVRRLAINVSGIGMSGEVVVRANRSSKVLGGKATFLMSTLGALASYKAPRVRVDSADAAGEASF